MSTLKVNKLRDTAGAADAIVLDPNGGAVLAGVTTISTARITTGITTSIQVGGGVTISESGIEASGIGITCASINGTQIGGRRNIIINGAMNVAQRNTSSTSSGYKTVDRFKVSSGGTDETPTQSQADVASGTTPYTEGFRKSYKIQNGNQTSGAGASDNIYLRQRIEAQDIAGSGWNYTSISSFITLSFWVKSSVAQNFYGTIKTSDGTEYNYPFETGSLSANTWTKVTKTISGNSNLTFNNDNEQGLRIRLAPFRGTNATGSVTLNQWGAFDTSLQYPNNTSTWYTTNDATFEITGVQLEVSDHASDFQFKSFAEELELCRRYFQQISPATTDGVIALGNSKTTTINDFVIYFNPNMRVAPALNVNGDVKVRNGTGSTQQSAGASIVLNEVTTSLAICRATNPQGGLTAGGVGQVRIVDGTTNNLQFSAEL